MRTIPRPETDSSHFVTVLLVSSFAEAHESLRQVFAHTNWHLSRASTLDQAVSALRFGRHAVVICERRLQRDTWRDLLDRTTALPYPPTVIVTDSNADERLWAEALNLGAYDVLSKPFDKQEVVRVVSAAWLQWRSRRLRQERLEEQQRPAASCA